MPETVAWHAIDLKEVEKLLKTNKEKGLAEHEARTRLADEGFNELPERKRRSPVMLLLSQFNDFMIWVLLAAVFIAGVILHETLDAVVIAVIVIANAILGFIQEYKAEQAISALKRLAAPAANIIRDGQEREILARELTPGDLILVETGDRVPADARLIEAINLVINEAILTGESTPSEKRDAIKLGEDVSLLDRENMLYLGTTVMTGRGKALVVATGPSTEMGKIAEMVQEPEEKETPLQNELRQVGKRIAIACLIIAAVVFGIGVLRGNDWSLMFLAGVSLAVAAIPEGLPAIVTITLALGLERMAKKNAIVRRLPAVETLGAATVICTDKTGTLTRNEMRVGLIRLHQKDIPLREESLPDDERLKMLLSIGVLCNDARKGAEEIYIGDPTEVALLIAGEQTNLSKDTLTWNFPRLSEIPFDSDRKMMTTIHSTAGHYASFSKGAPEILLSKCDKVWTDKDVEPLNDQRRAEILQENTKLASQAYRTIALAFREFDFKPDEKEAEKNLVFVGLAGLIDPPRPEVYEAIKTCQRAQIMVAMVTGDHLATAEAIGRELSLLSSDTQIITTSELSKMSEKDLVERANQISIYARITAEDKMRIIEALRKRGHTIAMTGDGVNDAPALRKADIGVAMGKIGADVAKEASDMVLTDDNFATIVTAIREGRVIFDNLKKFIYFLLSCNISEVLVMFLGMIFGLPLPLLPVQILWINLVTDGLPAMALGVDVPEPGVMGRPPRRKEKRILATDKQLNLAWQGLAMTAGALLSYIIALYVLKTGLAEARTILFTTLVLVQLFHVFNSRSERKSALEVGIFSSVPLLGALGASFLLQLLVIYTPPLRPLFHTEPVNIVNWLLILTLSILPVVAIEMIKKFKGAEPQRSILR